MSGALCDSSAGAVLNGFNHHFSWSAREHSGPLLNLNLAPSDHVVNSGADVVHFELPVQVPLDSLICINEVLELLLKAVILVVQIGHVLVEGINLSLKIGLVSHHAITLLPETVQLKSYRLLVLFQLAEGNLKLLALHATVLASSVLILVGVEQLLLGSLVLLVLSLKVSQLSIQLVQSVLELLDVLVSIGDLVVDDMKVVVFLSHNLLHSR